MWLKGFAAALQTYLAFQSPVDRIYPCNGSVTLSDEWQLLGPFQTGTREASWGADPLEQYGGFRALNYSANATYVSSLTANATVSWSIIQSSASTCSDEWTESDIVVEFPNVDWSFLQSFYGWAALQYQAWMRGTLYIESIEPRRVLLYTDHVLELYVDGKHFFGGDLYAYRRAPLVLTLDSGAHQIDLRLIRDVRAMGGVGPPTIGMRIKAEVSVPVLHLSSGKFLLPDVVNGSFAGTYASFVARNDDNKDVSITGISVTGQPESGYVSADLSRQPSIRLWPGQTRPVAFNIHCEGDCAGTVVFTIRCLTTGSAELFSIESSQQLVRRSVYKPHKVTHLHPAGIVSYSILRPPSTNASCTHPYPASVPILLQLHGAGLEAEDTLVAHALESLPDLCAFILFPTGVTPWSGDDWHRWGFADVEAAIQSIPHWAEATDWQGPRPDIKRWLVSGHSNGGQGTWYALMHRPDNVIAAAPVSGYSSIQNYVPYHFWHSTDPSIRAILDGALNSYRHELLTANAKGIPIMQQHGERDDNVPAYHSRLLNLLLRQSGVYSQFVELSGSGHWFDGVMTTDPLSSFYKSQLESNKSTATHEFSVVVANPADTGPKQDFHILSLLIPGRLGRVDVHYDEESGDCNIRTSNVFVFRIAQQPADCVRLLVDDQVIKISDLELPTAMILAQDLHWGVLPTTDGDELQEPKLYNYSTIRTRRQSGAMDSILDTSGALTIIAASPESQHTALQVSRNLCQYYAADTEIFDYSIPGGYAAGNIIILLTGDGTGGRIPSDYPISFGKDGVSIRDDKGRIRHYKSDDSIGAIFLVPLGDTALGLVVWGLDQTGLDIAARLVPMLTGVGQPDFVIIDKNILQNGASGVLAIGFFDAHWNVSKNSYFT